MRNRESNNMKIRAHGLKEMHMKSFSRHIVLALVRIVVGLYATRDLYVAGQKL